jgi:uncharacterized RDD family membrane protein YckC
MSRITTVLMVVIAAIGGAGAAAASVQLPQPPPAPAAPLTPATVPAPSVAIDAISDQPGAGEDRVSIGHDSTLPAGQSAHSVVAIGGSSSSEGTVRDDVVAVLGDTHVSGMVGHDAVAVLGSTYVNGHLGGDAVAVLGSVHLGPQAEVDGQVTAVGGRVERDPGAIVHGGVQEVAIGHGTGAGWAAPWVRHGMFYLRPLAWSFGLAWAWALALVFLAIYIALALVFRHTIQRCVQTFEVAPGPTILTAVLAALLTPVLLVLLVITLIGLAAVPLVLVALFVATLFGKTALLAWIGQHLLGARAGNTDRERAHPALGVLIGGLIVLALYFVPVVGFIVFQVLGLLGLGVAIYTLIASSPRHRAGGPAMSGPSTPPPPPSTLSAPPAPEPRPSPPPAQPASGAAPSPSGAAAAAAASAQTTRAYKVPLEPYAGFWVRMAALLVDALLIGIVVHLLPHARNIELLALATYGAVMWKLRGTTIGGIVFDLHVVRMDGRPVDWSTAIVRALGCFLSLAIAGLGFFWIAFDDSKQAWHDKFAGTVVLRMAKAPSLV